LTVSVLAGAGFGETLACKARSLAVPAQSGGSELTRAFQRRETINVTIPVRSAQGPTTATR
jgi:hypothetical protein